MVALIVFGSTLLGCSDGARALDNEEAQALVERVLGDLDLPGEPEPPENIPDIPEGELAFGFHCPIQSAGFGIDDVLVAFPRPEVGHDESPSAIERVEVAILVFDTAATASAVLAAYGDQRAVECLGRTIAEPVQLEADDPLEAGGVTADGFAMTFGPGAIQPDGHRTFAVDVGRILVDVTVLAPDEDRCRELAQDVLGGIVDALRAGGA